MVFSFQTGKQLKLIEADCQIYAQQMLEFKREAAHTCTLIFWQAILNLMGCQEDSTMLLGETLQDLDAFLPQELVPVVLALFHSMHSFLCLFLGEDEKGAKLAIERGDSYAKAAPGTYSTCCTCYLLIVHATGTV